MFQFPSNGKADPKPSVLEIAIEIREKVSIPFKRESGSKGEREIAFAMAQEAALFQFPSNGKADPKAVAGTVVVTDEGFQFPSNGKADPKECGWGVPAQSPNEFQFPSNGKADPK